MNEIKLLVEQKFPTREDILQAMQRKMGFKEPNLMDAILFSCSEVAEIIMLRQWRQEVEAEVTPEKVVVIRRKAKSSKKQHYCSNCQFQSVHPIHNFCPKCGTKIRWIESHEAPVIKIQPKKEHPWRKVK